MPHGLRRSRLWSRRRGGGGRRCGRFQIDRCGKHLGPWSSFFVASVSRGGEPSPLPIRSSFHLRDAAANARGRAKPRRRRIRFAPQTAVAPLLAVFCRVCMHAANCARCMSARRRHAPCHALLGGKHDLEEARLSRAARAATAVQCSHAGERPANAAKPFSTGRRASDKVPSDNEPQATLQQMTLQPQPLLQPPLSQPSTVATASKRRSLDVMKRITSWPHGPEALIRIPCSTVR